MTDRDVASAADLSHGTAPASNPPAAASPERDDALRQIAERLRAGRERQRLTVDDLATRLKVAPGKLLAVESADVSALPDMTFTKGLIRAYARALQVDVDDQLARLNARAQVTNIGLRPEGGLGESFSDKPSFCQASGWQWSLADWRAGCGDRGRRCARGYGPSQAVVCHANGGYAEHRLNREGSTDCGASRARASGSGG